MKNMIISKKAKKKTIKKYYKHNCNSKNGLNNEFY